jgi:preprotein translocase subunit SecD
MRRKKALIYLIGITVFSVLVLGATFAVGNSPLLGLDLEGGVSVRLTPTTDATDEQIEQAITIMNQRINSLGVAEPDIHREGGTIVVQIAGLKDEDKDKAIALVGQTAELRFRPVMQSLAPEQPPAAATPGSTVPGTPPGSDVPTTTAVPPSTEAPPSSQQTGMGEPGGVEGESAAGAQTPTTVSDGPAPAPTATANACGSTAPAAAPDPSRTTTPEEDKRAESACDQVVLKGDPRTETTPQRYLLGPACNPVTDKSTCLTGAALEGATANINPSGKWTVNPVFKNGPDGIDRFNALAAKCFQGAPECPTKQMAITLDGLVLSAPTINSASFQRDQIEISGSFNEETAKGLSTGLKYGSLPVQLRQESSEAVSATLGRDALNAGLAAGAVGFLLVGAYMIAFYRILGILALFKLAVEGALMWTIISFMSAQVGLALTLAGVMGIIMSIGVSLDSNVVYYEHLREDIRSGRTLRSAVERSFETAWGTILKADGASLLGAALLYLLAVGPVRGFAFFLGLSTVLELITSYYFMRPAVYLSTNTKLCRTKPGLFGLPHDVQVVEPSSTTISRPSRRGRPGAGDTRAPTARPARADTATATGPAEAGTTNGSAGTDPSDTDPATTEAK